MIAVGQITVICTLKFGSVRNPFDSIMFEVDVLYCRIYKYL